MFRDKYLSQLAHSACKSTPGPRLSVRPGALSFLLAEQEPGQEEAGSEECRKGGLQAIVMSKCKHAVQSPGQREHEPDERAPHEGQVSSRHRFRAADTLRSTGL